MASQIPPNVMAIQGGSGILFIEPPHWVCFALSLSTIGVWLSGLLGVFGRSSVAKGLLSVGGLIAFISVSANIIETFFEGFHEYVVTRIELAFDYNTSQRFYNLRLLQRFEIACRRLRFLQIEKFGVLLQQNLVESLSRNITGRSPYRLIELLNATSYLDDETKRKSLMYIPHTDKIYWSLLPCQFVPMISPAITGLASLVGLPPPSCPAKLFGVICYPAPKMGDPAYSESKALDISDIARLGSERNFVQVLVLSTSDSSFPITVVDCKTQRTKKITVSQLSQPNGLK
jgi:hypothetical protein